MTMFPLTVLFLNLSNQFLKHGIIKNM